MSVDPDPLAPCTFWYTQEYQANDDSQTDFDFKTHIGVFTMPVDSCSTDPVTDIAITDVSAPSPAVQDDVVQVSVTVKNVGNQDVSTDVQVTLVDDNATPSDGTDDVEIGMQTVGGLAAGASQPLFFDWQSTTVGDHELTATHYFTDDNSGGCPVRC